MENTQEPMTAHEVLTREYMLVNFTAKAYRGKAKDKVQSDKINRDAGATGDVAKVELELFKGCDAEISSINSSISGLRQLFYTMTQPWSLDETKRDGDRLIANIKLFEFINKYQEARHEIEVQLNALELVWPDRVEQAKLSLGTLYREEMYPTFAEVRRKWGLRIDYHPVPAAGDYKRLSVPAEVANKMAAVAERRATELMEAAVKDAFEKTHELVKRLAGGTRVENYVNDEGEHKQRKGKVYDSTVDGLQEMIDNLRHFNITNDPKLEQVRQRLSKMMVGIDVKELRNNETSRGHVHHEATQIADDMLTAMQQMAA